MKLQKKLIGGLCVGLFFCALCVRPAHAISGTITQSGYHTPANSTLYVQVDYTWSVGFARPNLEAKSSLIPVGQAARPYHSGTSGVFATGASTGLGNFPWQAVCNLRSDTYGVHADLLESSNANYVIASDDQYVVIP